MPAWLQIIVATATLSSIAVSIFVAWLYQTRRADLALFELKILTLLNEKYLSEHNFQKYSEAHAREHHLLLVELGKIKGDTEEHE